MSQPNVVLILADDLGYGDVGAYNAESRIPTPHLDRLAADGMMFTNAHASAAQCSPTRYSVMTGRYPWCTRLKTGVLKHFDAPLLEPEEGLYARWLTYGHRSCGPYQGYKGNVYDGGHRVPFLVRWPGSVPAGRVEDETICLTDFMATFAALFDVDLPDNVAEDSYNLLPVLLGRKPEQPVREATICQSWWGVKCIYKGPWKLIVGNGKDGIHYEKSDTAALQLYHIVDDVGETRNVHEQYPEVVAELAALLEKYCQNQRSVPPANHQI